MFGFFSSLFGGSKATEKVVDTGSYLLKEASSGIDMMFYTDEEKAQAKAQTYNMWLETQKIVMQQGSPQAITRRLIAVPWMFMQMAMTSSAVVAKGFSVWMAGNAATAAEKAQVVSEALHRTDFSDYVLALQNDQLWLTGAIAGFYFGPAAFEMMASKFKKKD